MFQGLDSESSMRHDAGQLCTGEHVTGSNCSLNMVSWNCQNMVGLSLRGVQKLTCQGSARCNRQLFSAITSVVGRWELFLCAKHVVRDRYEMLRKYFGWAEAYG